MVPVVEERQRRTATTHYRMERVVREAQEQLPRQAQMGLAETVVEDPQPVQAEMVMMTQQLIGRAEMDLGVRLAVYLAVPIRVVMECMGLARIREVAVVPRVILKEVLAG